MKCNRILIGVLILFSLVQIQLFAQEVDSIEVYLIDSYVTPEQPNTFILSFFTSDQAKSRVVINDEYEFQISEELAEDHKIEIDVSQLQFDKQLIPYIIYVEDAEGNEFRSEKYEFDLPYEIKVESESNFLLLCLFAGTVFALPSPAYVSWNEEDYFSLTKEIPVVSIRSGKYNYPMGYFSIEYSYIFNGPVKNFFRIGYKHIIEIPGIEYISPGVNGFTNFNGFNGISPEVSVGWIKIYNAFTLYTRYRFNAKPGASNSEFHEITLGLYSNFFSLYF